MVRFMPGDQSIEPIPRRDTIVTLPTEAGGAAVPVTVTARSGGLVHVVFTDEDGDAYGTWCPAGRLAAGGSGAGRLTVDGPSSRTGSTRPQHGAFHAQRPPTAPSGTVDGAMWRTRKRATNHGQVGSPITLRFVRRRISMGMFSTGYARRGARPPETSTWPLKVLPIAHEERPGHSKSFRYFEEGCIPASPGEANAETSGTRL